MSNNKYGFQMDTLISEKRRNKLFVSIVKESEKRTREIDAVFKKYDKPKLSKKDREQFIADLDALEERHSKSRFLHSKYTGALEGEVQEKKKKNYSEMVKSNQIQIDHMNDKEMEKMMITMHRPGGDVNCAVNFFGSSNSVGESSANSYCSSVDGIVNSTATKSAKHRRRRPAEPLDPLTLALTIGTEDTAALAKKLPINLRRSFIAAPMYTSPDFELNELHDQMDLLENTKLVTDKLSNPYSIYAPVKRDVPMKNIYRRKNLIDSSSTNYASCFSTLSLLRGPTGGIVPQNKSPRRRSLLGNSISNLTIDSTL